MEDKNKKNNEDRYLEVVIKLLYLIIALMIFVGLFVYINIDLATVSGSLSEAACKRSA